ncbi:MAG: hypothetical protein GY926_06010 [bacterium]|nr:hypothetical protein [bacterium]
MTHHDFLDQQITHTLNTVAAQVPVRDRLTEFDTKAAIPSGRRWRFVEMPALAGAAAFAIGIALVGGVLLILRSNTNQASDPAVPMVTTATTTTTTTLTPLETDTGATGPPDGPMIDMARIDGPAVQGYANKHGVTPERAQEIISWQAEISEQLGRVRSAAGSRYVGAAFLPPEENDGQAIVEIYIFEPTEEDFAAVSKLTGARLVEAIGGREVLDQIEAEARAAAQAEHPGFIVDVSVDVDPATGEVTIRIEELFREGGGTEDALWWIKRGVVVDASTTSFDVLVGWASCVNRQVQPEDIEGYSVTYDEETVTVGIAVRVPDGIIPIDCPSTSGQEPVITIELDEPLGNRTLMVRRGTDPPKEAIVYNL